jgi:hypothetical protein
MKRKMYFHCCKVWPLRYKLSFLLLFSYLKWIYDICKIACFVLFCGICIEVYMEDGQISSHISTTRRTTHHYAIDLHIDGTTCCVTLEVR